ncbi:MAG: rRNA pseudouridine synthase [Gammaproteobacteria bacterium]|nr:MAG: rRNA pseudouridine synthase [Gammaproteobacteria bacterium]TLY83988.1 MAG: rRNA pseudouridine synthase [Gammaproteobacteria bacterium]
MIRLQKLLAAAGLGSRRAIEEWIRAGRVSVGGRIVQLGDRATSADDVRLDGVKLDLDRARAAPPELLLYYKPVGEVTTRSDPQRRPTVFRRLPPPRTGRWIAVGRLDVNTAGLLLLTTDGELAHRLMHPSSEVQREYLVRVRGRPGPQVLRQLLSGVHLEDGPARFDRISAEGRDGGGGGGRHSAFRVVLHEGRNREVRRLWSAVGFEVSRLLRIRYGSVELPRDLRPGEARVADPALIGGLERFIRASGRPRPRSGPPGELTREAPVSGLRRGAPTQRRRADRPPGGRPPSK